MKFFLLLFTLVCTNCENFDNDYSGYVYDRSTKKPLSKVLVRENFVKNSKQAFTDSNGFFKIKNDSEAITDLVFLLNGYKSDTAVTAWSQHGEKMEYRFLNKKNDTIFLEKEIDTIYIGQ
ncbi:hypothetical protein FLACOL_02146 [Flavobacterium columnare]|uniref:Carboxypeptidase-like regulatory domain-containing protein n=2 Tax=Flavobacterium TaxID=237 RepID=A0ABW8PT09_9FLAO|nr:carboxypeptidase-like regulatory domain-containing protein [Flavobacterium columnare]SPE78131.1 hypothetical protein FLACOL_02146 [Flavobacterium columnare]